MAIPTWRDMPDTSSIDAKQAVIVRARHRRLMAIRWRYPQAREEDRRLGRLPTEWHDWMQCPGYEGYQGPLCTCDRWTGPREPVRFGQLAAGPATRRVVHNRHVYKARERRKSIDTSPELGILVIYAADDKEIVVPNRRPRTVAFSGKWRSGPRRRRALYRRKHAKRDLGVEGSTQGLYPSQPARVVAR